jgi:trimeric autotransporter adhesin
VRKNSSKIASAARPQRVRAAIESLEPRLLYSADLSSVALSANSVTGAEPGFAVAVQQTVAATATQPTQQSRATHMVFVVDLRVTDAQLIVNGLKLQQDAALADGQGFDILTIDANEDGIAKTSQFLSTQTDVTALHIISHGQDGMMLLGNQWLDNSAMRSRSSELSAWGNALHPDADILLYGCDFAKGVDGKNTVTALAQLTGADVAASTDTTANDTSDGNWNFEFTHGSVTSDATNVRRAAADWRGKLATYVVTNTNNSGAGSLRAAITSANASFGTDQITFNIATPLVGGSHLISLTSALPNITDAVVIDGDTQPDAVTLGRATVEISKASGNFDGLTFVAGANGSTVSGLSITNFAIGIAVETNDVTIRHNVIGLHADGASAGANTNAGIVVRGTGTIIGGATTAMRNVISGNASDGIIVESLNTVIQGNYIGVGLDGDTNFGNGTSGFGSGVYIINVADTQIGGVLTGTGNVISNNRESAIYIGGNSASNTKVYNNSIGLTRTGTAAGNGIAGIEIASGAYGNTIGGTTAGMANTIANSGTRFTAAGVLVGPTAGTGNTVSANSIYGSSGLGIDTGATGVNASGKPVLSFAATNGTNTIIRGSFQGTANTSYRFEFFSNDPAIGLDPSGYGEGQTYLNTITLTSDGAGLVSFDGLNSHTVSWSLPLGHRVAATATDLSTGATTEFSAAIAVDPVNITYVYPGVIAVSESGTSAVFSLTLGVQPSADVVISTSITDATEAILSTNSLTFTSANWNVAQTVTLTGISDTLVDGTTAYNVIVGRPVSADALYNGMTGRSFSAVTLDTNTYNSIVVDTTADLTDGDTTSIATLTANRGADGRISLREAIIAANNTPNASLTSPDHIEFNLTGATVNGMHVIALGSNLTKITNSIVIDGATDPSYAGTPTVRVDGARLYSGIDLLVGTNGSTINALAVTSMLGDGITLQSDNNQITSSYVGNTGMAGAGNTVTGIRISGANNNIGLDGRGNVISGNNWDNIFLVGAGAHDNHIVANLIGTNVAGSAALVNGRSGITLLNTGIGNVIGGLTTQSRNTISGNYAAGVELQGASTQYATIQNSFIGTDSSGTRALSNQSGVTIWNGASNNLIGGTLGARNVISGNLLTGITVGGGSALSSNNRIEGNFIGVDSGGNLPLGNGYEGIEIRLSSNTIIGGTTAIQRNIVSSNGNSNRDNILVNDSADGTVIQGNYVGLNYNGTGAYSGVGRNGITVSGATNTLIGGTAVGAGNVISGNTNAIADADGIYVNNGSDRTTIQGNLIGFAADGITNMANIHGGIVFDAATNGLVGGTTPGAANVIGNGQLGVVVSFSASNIAILGNKITGTTAPAIDLAGGTNGDGVTNNDLGDADTGSNGLQNFPVLQAASRTPLGLEITGTLNSQANKTYRIEFFTNPSAQGHSTGYGAATAFLGSINVTTDSLGNAIFSNQPLIGLVAVGDVLTATATEILSVNQYGATSEFAQNIIVQAQFLAVSVTPTSPPTISENGTLTTVDYALLYAPLGNVTINFSVSDTTEARLSTNILTFTPSNWNVVQTLSIEGVDDSFIDGSKAFRLYTTVAAVSDPALNGLLLAPIDFVNQDNDTSNVIVVDTTADTNDGDTSSIEALYASKGADGRISLREAILAANMTGNGSASDLIRFNITDPLVNGAHSILLTTLLPAISDAVTIDGSTEPDFANHPVVELTGGNTVTQGLIVAASGSEIRGLTINNFAAQGILIYQGALNTGIFGNYIGTDVTGLMAAGNTSWGIDIIGPITGTTIGGLAARDRNIIADNGQGGIAISNAQNTIVIGNYIGVGADGVTAIGNGWGILMNANTNGTIIRENTIANSLAQGIVLIDANSAASILSNIIYANAGIGIDLGADTVTVNDLQDSDLGANNLQNYPVLQVATSSGGSTNIFGNLNSSPSTTYRLEFFAAAVADSSDHGQAEIFLGFTDVTTDAAGNTNFTRNFANTIVPIDWVVTATTTEILGSQIFGNTSEFSQSIVVTAVPPAVFVSNLSGGVSTSEQGGAVTFSIALSTQPSAAVTVNFSLSSAGEATLSTQSITFTPINWNTVNHTITVTGKDDTFVDGSKPFVLNISKPITMDPGYALVQASNIALTNTDNDFSNAIEVDTHVDISDGNVSSIEALYANKGADGRISLREAITAANNTANGISADELVFNINSSGPIEINLNSQLPTITDSININGTSQPGYNPASNNYIRINGFDSAGMSVGGGVPGLTFAASNSTVRGLSIQGFDGAGIVVMPGSTGIQIREMTIEGNTGLPIDLGNDGATLNDANDMDSGANHLQNFPLLTSISTDGVNNIWLSGSFDGAASRTLIIDVYEHGDAGLASDRSRYVGSFVTTTDANGAASFNQVLSANFVVGTRFSAIATDITNSADSNSSEFSPIITSVPAWGIVVSPISNDVNESGTTGTFTIVLNTQPLADVLINLSPSVAGEVSLSTSSIVFTAANWDQAQTITITGLQDFMSNGATSVVIITAGAQSGDSRFNGFDPIDVALVNYEIANQAPIINGVGNTITAENTGLSLNGLSIADGDAGGSLMKVTLSAANGLISLNNLNGLTFSVGDGSADSTMVFFGNVANVNQAIDNLQFTPTANFSGAAQVDINVDDLGNSGFGGSQIASKPILINVSAISKVPILPTIPPIVNVGTYGTPLTVFNTPSEQSLDAIGPSNNQTSAGSVADSFRDVISNSYGTNNGTERVDTKALAVDTTKTISSVNAKNALRDYRSKDGRLEQQTSSAIVRLEQLKKASRAFIESQSVDNTAELLNRKPFAGDSTQQLFALWKPTDLTRPKAAVSLGNFEMPANVITGFVPLENIDKSVDVEHYQAIVNTLEMSGFAVSAASVAWVARASGLLAAVLAAFPAWKVFDPLHVLSAEEKKQLNHSLEFSNTDILIDEEAVGAVF